MHRTRSIPLALGFLVLSACAGTVPQPRVPAPAPRAVPPPPPPPQAQAPAPTPRPVAPPEPTSWIDAAKSLGNWSYSGGPARTMASFGREGMAADLTISCDRASRNVVLSRHGVAEAPVLMRVLTESTVQLLDAEAASDQASTIAIVPSRDPILDAMAFSRGRFAVETSGMPTLYLPSWAEVTRVVEDCR